MSAERPAFCSGYQDENGVWQNGFLCPSLNGKPRQCCINENKKYCCFGKTAVSSIIAFDPYSINKQRLSNINPIIQQNQTFNSLTEKYGIDSEFLNKIMLPTTVCSLVCLILVVISFTLYICCRRIKESKRLPIYYYEDYPTNYFSYHFDDHPVTRADNRYKLQKRSNNLSRILVADEENNRYDYFKNNSKFGSADSSEPLSKSNQSVVDSLINIYPSLKTSSYITARRHQERCNVKIPQTTATTALI
ncbi:hypothetical protein GJ496_004136 [Pomphorhynchus laevis]|nr:hypothetical protein GJ496_004136 [Pomphorhynchus laevis]